MSLVGLTHELLSSYWTTDSHDYLDLYNFEMRQKKINKIIKIKRIVDLCPPQTLIKYMLYLKYVVRADALANILIASIDENSPKDAEQLYAAYITSIKDISDIFKIEDILGYEPSRPMMVAFTNYLKKYIGYSYEVYDMTSQVFTRTYDFRKIVEKCGLQDIADWRHTPIELCAAQEPQTILSHLGAVIDFIDDLMSKEDNLAYSMQFNSISTLIQIMKDGYDCTPEQVFKAFDDFQYSVSFNANVMEHYMTIILRLLEQLFIYAAKRVQLNQDKYVFIFDNRQASSYIIKKTLMTAAIAAIQGKCDLYWVSIKTINMENKFFKELPLATIVSYCNLFMRQRDKTPKHEQYQEDIQNIFNEYDYSKTAFILISDEICYPRAKRIDSYYCYSIAEEINTINPYHICTLGTSTYGLIELSLYNEYQLQHLEKTLTEFQ